LLLMVKGVKSENPFAKDTDNYIYIITELGGTDLVLNAPSFKRTALAFNNRDFAAQVALHQLLYRKLLKYAYDSGTIDCAEWNGNNRHYCVVGSSKGNYYVRAWLTETTMNNVYFDSERAVRNAIENVILPFEKEHPEFIW